MAVDGKGSRLAALKAVMNGSIDFYTAEGPLEAFYWAEKLRSVDLLVLNEPEDISARPLDLLRALQETLKEAEKTVKILVVDPAGMEELRRSHLISPADAILPGPMAIEDLGLEIRRRLARLAKEKRSSLRVPISGSRPIKVEVDGEGSADLLDLSETGMSIRTGAGLDVGAAHPFVLHISDDERWQIEGIIVRSTESGVGVAFRPMDEDTRRRIFNRLAESVSLKDLEELKSRYPELHTSEMIAFRSPEKILGLLEAARDSRTEITALPARARIPVRMVLETVAAGRVCRFRGRELDLRFKTSDPVFISFQSGYATYNFETTVRRILEDGLAMECFFPRVIFYSEKRSEKRETPGTSLRLEIPLPPPFRGRITGPIVDITESGACFLADAHEYALFPGTPLETVRILEDDREVRVERAEVRNVVPLGTGPSPRFRYGLQFGIGRSSIQTLRPRDLSPAASASPGDASADTAASDEEVAALSRLPPEVIRLENGRGEEIVGLLNTSFPHDGRPVPVVLIPPAFGKTKETLFGLALTLIENFRRRGLPLAVLRYDGIRCKGESYKDPEAEDPPLETINSSLSQGAEDIKAVVDWLRLNPRLKAGPIVLVTFSLSALEARIALRDAACRHSVKYWIACLGTLEFRDLMNRVNCGLDLLEQHQLGIDLGIIPILGNLIRMRHYAGDVVANGVASLDQAREDMRHLDLPVTWIYGTHDNWVKPEFVRDVMSIRAGAPREVLAMPIGHNARTSEEAFRLFGTVTSLTHRFLHQTMIRPVPPDRKGIEILRRAEKDRLPSRGLANRKSYWTHYLVGEKDLLGFDTMTLSDDYRQLMDDQIGALDPSPEDRILDLGGGTGNFIECLVQSGRPLPARVVLADLIPEAMTRGERKLAARGIALRPSGRLALVVLDSELNRFLPVRRFLEGKIGRFEELADRIENLPLQSATRIDDAYSPRLHRILRGEEISPEHDVWLKGSFELEEQRIIRDFNLAARIVRREAANPNGFRKLAFPGGLESPGHLPFKPGSFDKILMSLVLSYLFDPVETLRELRRIIAPGGHLVLSSMRPDTDASGLFTRLLDKIAAAPAEALPPEWPKARLLDSMRSFLNDAQALVDLEEAGAFDFFDPDKLAALLDESGWNRIRTLPSFGHPPQGYIVIAAARPSHD